MQSRNKILDDVSQLMTNAMGVAQGAREEAETAVKSVIDRWLADHDFVTREEFDAYVKEKKYEIFNKYFENLYQCFTDYKEQYDFLKTFVKKVHIGPFNIQRYFPGGHFARLHAERTDMTTIHRLFAWMTYLNDVEEGGTTDFDYYKVKIKPQTGKTLIWPAEWTHAHTGSVLKGGKKYIITGWLHFTD